MDAEQTTPPTAPSLGRVTIKNFKSIKEVSFDTRRINLFVGRPNTGKSNILEAISLLSARGSIAGTIRFNKIRDLFFRLNDRLGIEVITPKTKVAIQSIDNLYFFSREDFRYPRENSRKEMLRTELLQNGAYKEPFNPVILDSRVRGVVSDRVWLERFSESTSASLIVRALRSDKELLSTLGSFLKEYGLQIAFYGDEIVLSQGSVEDQLVLVPFSMISDTMKRLFFYFSLISMASKWIEIPDYVLLLEEPESNSYPPYVSLLASRIAEAKSNQFFIATHSPYLVNTLLDEVPDAELGIFIVEYVNHETKVHMLSDDDLQDIRVNSLDIFYNLDNLLEDAEWKK